MIVGESGENVFPDELEDSFSELPHAEHICVAGVAAKGVYDDTTLVVHMGENTGDAEKTAELISEIARINASCPYTRKSGGRIFPWILCRWPTASRCAARRSRRRWNAGWAASRRSIYAAA